MVGGGPGAGIAPSHRRAARLDGRFELVAGAFSRTADANRAMDPVELETPGRRLLIPMPQPGDT